MPRQNKEKRAAFRANWLDGIRKEARAVLTFLLEAGAEPPQAHYSVGAIYANWNDFLPDIERPSRERISMALTYLAVAEDSVYVIRDGARWTFGAVDVE